MSVPQRLPALAGLGVRPGDRVLLVAPSVPEFVAAYLGIEVVGAIAVTVNTMSAESELEHVIGDASRHRRGCGHRHPRRALRRGGGRRDRPADAVLEPQDLRTWTKERLSAYKVPRLFSFVDALPKGPTGKILKRAIDTEALSRAGTATRTAAAR